MTDQKNRSERGGNTPEPGQTDTHPATEAAATGRHGGPPGTVATGDTEGPGREGTARDPSITMETQDAFWRAHFADRDYVDESRGYEYYRPAYRYGWESRAQHGDRDFEAVAPELERDWDPDTGLSWGQARPAIRDAYERAATDTSTPGNPLS
jgi:hypothetical protein